MVVQGYICLRGYVDVDLAGEIDNKKSTTRYVSTLGSVVVIWVSQLQKMVTISTTKAEYVTATQAYKEIAWLKGLLKELDMVQNHCRLFSDNHNAIHIAKNSIFHSRTKHIDNSYQVPFAHSLWIDTSLWKRFTQETILQIYMPTKMITIEKLKLCSTSVDLQG